MIKIINTSKKFRHQVMRYFQMRGMEAKKYFYPVTFTERKINKLLVLFMHFLPERKKRLRTFRTLLI